MNDRIRIDSRELGRAPEAEVQQRRGGLNSAAGGEVFGQVESTRTDAGQLGGAGIWAKPKLLYSLAGLAAAIVASIMTDGVAGFGTYEQTGRNAPWWVGLVFMCSFSAFVTMCIAAVDDVVASSYVRGLLFGLVGFIGGLVSGAIALFAGGIVFEIIGTMLSDAREGASSRFEFTLLAMVMRAPAWLIVGALCGAVVGGLGRSMRRALLGAAGGAVGGLVGGMLFDPLNALTDAMFSSGNAWFSRFIALAVMGAATGFAIAFAEQAAKQAWLAIERGRLIGKQFIVYRNPTRIGASYSNDVFLFKDASVQPEHARITRRGGAYQIEALPGALVRVNAHPIASKALASGDTVQIGETVMRFNTKS